MVDSKNKPMMFKLPLEDDAELERIGMLEDRTKSWQIRLAIKKYLMEKNEARDTN